MEFRKWQKQALKEFIDKKKLILDIATGAGKTFCAINMIKLLEKQTGEIPKTLIVAPKNVIIEDTWFKELISNGYHINKIGLVNGKMKEFGKITLTNTTSVKTMWLDMFDFLIIDEVHNFATPELLKVLNKNFKYKVGLSATTKRKDYKHWQIYKAFDYNIFTYTIKEGLEDGIVNSMDFYDYSIQLPSEDRELYNEYTEKITNIIRKYGSYNYIMSLPGDNHDKLYFMKYVSRRNKLVWNHKNKLEVIKNICEKEEGKRIVIFGQFNEMANSIYYFLSSEGFYPCVFHSNMSETDKKQSLKDFSNGDRKILISTKAIEEGWNLPDATVGIIIAGEKNDRQIIQRTGRVLRKKEENSKIYQVYLEDTFESENANKNTEMFKEYYNSYQKINV